ncbi:hypothetical protein MAR_018325 [Mya arenaria]|uniref:Endonuclease/exonuclease/phosphatase domain-containing protein n=1 Tax=Mya arenaria TaxID=6604 RepID=A0ABY7EHK2_MYAAR|nr:hypothetical protein MAR_018325 [Mya arenaria]
MTLTYTSVLKNDSLRICTWNARGVMSSAASLSNLLPTYQIDIAFITEHDLFDHSKYFFDTIQNEYGIVMFLGDMNADIVEGNNQKIQFTLMKCTNYEAIVKAKFIRHAKPYWTPEVKKSYNLQREARRVWVLEGQPRQHNESYAKYKRCKQNFVTTQKIVIENVEKYFNKPGDILKVFTNYFRDVYSPLQCEHFDNDFKKLLEEKVEQLKVKKTVPQIAFQK